MVVQLTAVTLLAAFYGVYIGKMALLARRNVPADIMGKGKKPRNAIAVEIALKCITYAGAVVQFTSVLFSSRMLSLPTAAALRAGGIFAMAIGVAVFVLAVAAMKSNWRAGYSEGQRTELVTGGIYQYSRNPAFLAFDLMYIGCAMAFPSLINVAFMLAAVVLFHFQILGEERFLTHTFAQRYLDYQRKTRRYVGVK